MGEVKRAGKRALKAQETRRRILEAARELFVERGYGATMLQEVADKAGVAVQTIYFVFGNKRTLLKELVDTTIAGDDEPVATMDRPWFRDALAAGTADAHLRAHLRGTRGILERIAPIMKVVDTAAAMDPEVAELWQHDEDPRFTVQATAAKALMAKEGAREGLPVAQAADVLFALLSPELYLLFVRERGWSPERWERWAYDTLRPQLCAA
ncbi:helix-turn-helix domain-containing protein [Streptomyces sp. NPDC048483]|uniref:TetR/AcrR family transcriptional regulator n=1 Tax=Streptomyces sp. NPDC048483 TaxID=3154927 RepID=UPI0034255872